MTDDSFFREVNEEIRQDQARALWDRYGTFLLVLAVAVVLGTAAYVAWDYFATKRANGAGDAFSQALTLAGQGKNDEALAALDVLEKDGHGAYPLLARMRAATVLANKGDAAGAVKEFDLVAADGAIPASVRDIASLRAALILVDNGAYEEVGKRASPLAVDVNPLRHSAREALGLSAWKNGRAADALTLFTQITSDEAAPRNLRDRARLMSELIRGAGDAS